MSGDIENFRQEYERLSKEVDRIDGRQESTREELARLEQDARDIGFEPENLDKAIAQLEADAAEALEEVRAHLTALGEETGVGAE